LPDLEDIKTYLRLETDIEDDLVDQLNLTAQALVEQHLKVPLGSDSRTFYARWPLEGRRKEVMTRLTIPVVPCASSATITDIDGEEVDSDTYTIDSRTGYVETVRWSYFDNGPYDITVNVGWEQHPDYNTRIDPLLRQAVLDLASDLYSRRNPGAIYEQSGGQVSITYTEADIPNRTKTLLTALQSISSPAW
jgi:uncharacterized phiE125 gp8 family phage protein